MNLTVCRRLASLFLDLDQRDNMTGSAIIVLNVVPFVLTPGPEMADRGLI